MVRWITRAQWGARPPSSSISHRAHELAGDVMLTVHHEGTVLAVPQTDYGAAVRAIQSFHMDHRRYSDIAYGAVIAPDGSIYVGRDERHYVGAHAKSTGNAANLGSFSLATLGGLGPWDDLTPASFDAIRAVVGAIALTPGNRLTSIVTHRWWAKSGRGGTVTACPGEINAALVELLRAQLQMPALGSLA